MKSIRVILILICLSADGLAAGNIHIGQLQIEPVLSVTESYTDNVFAVNTDTRSDWITTITPGIQLVMPVKMHTITAEYHAVIANLADFKSEDTTDHHARVLADFKTGNFFGFRVGDTYTRGHEGRSSTYSGEIEKYDRNAATVGVSYQMTDRSEARMDYTRTTWNYQLDTNQFRNRDEDLISTWLQYRFLPKTSAFVEYDFRNIVYDENSLGLNSTVHLPFLGVTWNMSEFTRGTAKLGYLFKRFETSDRKDIDTYAASLDVNHRFPNNSSIRLAGIRDVNESNDRQVVYYVTTSAFAEYTQYLTYKISALIRASYGVDDYVNATDTGLERQDHVLLTGLGLRYRMRDWLEFWLDYNHTNRDSNIDERNLVENRFSVTVTVTP